MAETMPALLSRPLAGLTRLPAHKQFGTILGLAVVIAVAAAVAMYGFQPRYQLLLPEASGRDIAEARALLDRNGIPHKLDARTGSLSVPADRVHEARLGLATEGLPRQAGFGFEILEQETGLGTSRMLETARHQRALEGELGRSIMTLQSVESARVHLALPQPSVFLRERSKPSASVIVNLRAGRQLDDAQIAGIVHMVASSVPGLEAERVAVVDHAGRLLSQADGRGRAPTQQLDYTHKLEEAYRQRVEAILAPIVGLDGMRVQVTADVDFTQVESTLETYDSEPVLRSEQLTEEETVGALAMGVPGSLTNQPPAGAVVAATGEGAELDEGTAAAETGPTSRNRRSTRNYEIDRKIDHVRQAPATLERLSVAVVVDHKPAVNEEGVATRVPRSAEEMAHLTTLVRQAVGFDEARGDRLDVVNASFRVIDSPAALDELPIWQQPWAQDIARHLAAALGLIAIAVFVLRPVLRSLAAAPPPRTIVSTVVGDDPALPAEGVEALPPASAAAGPSERDREVEAQNRELERARSLAAEDPRLVAQVVRKWINEDGR